MNQHGRIFISATSARAKDAARLLVTVLGRPLVILHDRDDAGESVFSEEDVVVVLDDDLDSSGDFQSARVFKLTETRTCRTGVRCRLANGETHTLRSHVRRHHEQTGFESEPTCSNRAAAMLTVSLRRYRKSAGENRFIDRLDSGAGLLLLERLIGKEEAAGLKGMISGDRLEDDEPIAILETELAREDSAGYQKLLPSLRRFLEAPSISDYRSCRPTLLAHPALLLHTAFPSSESTLASRENSREIFEDYEKHARTAKRRCGLLGAAMMAGDEQIVQSVVDDLSTSAWSVQDSALMALAPESQNIERSLLSAMVIAAAAMRTENARLDSLLPGFDQYELSWQGFGSQSMAHSIEGADQRFIDLASNSIARCLLENWLALMEQPPTSKATFVIDDLFGKIFGIERVHILKKQDTLQDVLEKISLVPESKLLYIEKTAGQDNYAVQNVLTLGDLLTYLCPTQSEDHILLQYKPESNYFKEKF